LCAGRAGESIKKGVHLTATKNEKIEAGVAESAGAEKSGFRPGEGWGGEERLIFTGGRSSGTEKKR